MFWSTKKKVPKKIRTIGQALQEDKVPVWQNKYILEIETQVHTPDLKIKDTIRNPLDVITTLVYDCSIAFYKQDTGNYLVLIDKVYKNKKDQTTLTVIEELSQIIGRHANTVVYEIDTKTMLPVAIHNYEDVVRLWQKDKKIIEEYYIGRPAQVLINSTDQKIMDQNRYTQLLYRAFPNGILVDTCCAYYQPIKRPFTISSQIVPNGHVTLPIEIHTKNTEEFAFSAHRQEVLDIEMVKKTFQIKQSIPDKEYLFQTNLACTLSLQPDKKSWDKGSWILEIDCKGVYHKRIHLKLTAL